MKRVCFVTLAVALLATSAAGCAPTQTSYNYGSTSSASSSYLMVDALVDAINREAENVTATNVETGGTYDNMRRMQAGTIDWANSTFHGANELYTGMGEFAGKGVPDLRHSIVTANQFNMFLVRSDLGIEDVMDLDGQEFNPGMAGSETNLNTKRGLESLGINYEEYVGATSEAVSAVKDRQIAGYAKSTSSMTTLDSSQLDVSTAMDITFLGYTDEQKDIIEADYPQIPWAYIEKGQIEGAPDMVGWVTGILVVQVCSTRATQEDVYQVVKAWFGDMDRIIAAYPKIEKFRDPAANLEEYLTMGEQAYPLHAGAVQYYEEQGLVVPARLIPPEYED